MLMCVFGYCNLIEIYLPLDKVTMRSLQHAIKAHGIPDSELGPDAITNIMSSYDNLTVFPDAAELLEGLGEGSLSSANTPGGVLEHVIFSNGTPTMIEAAISSSPLLQARFGPESTSSSLLGQGNPKYISIYDLNVYKPSPKAYNYVLKKLEREGLEKSVYLVSGNPFDIVGAKVAGLGTIWVNRTGTMWADCLLGEEERPQFEVKGLGEVMELPLN